MSKKEYLVLPYVNFKDEVSFDDFVIWKNSKDNWIKHIGRDNTDFLKRYVNDKGIPISNIYIITSTSEPVTYLKWERLIHTLFFIALPAYTFRFPSVYADNFYYEVWQGLFDASGDGYRKIDKFVNTFVMSEVKERIYPDQYVQLGLEIDIHTDSDKLKFFEDEFKKDYDSSLMRSLSFFFKTQYRNSAHFSQFDDAINYCTAFQVLLEVNEVQDITKILAKKLVEAFNDDPTKSKLTDSTKAKLEEWMKDMYKSIRSKHTHAGTTDYSKLTYGNMRHIDIAGIVYQLLLDQNYIDDFLGISVSVIRKLFDSQEIFENTINLLTKKRAKDNFFNCNEKEFKQYENLLYDILLDTELKIIIYKNSNKIKSALKTLIYILEHVCNSYNKDDESEYYIDPIIKLSQVIDDSKSLDEVIDKLPTSNYPIKPGWDDRKEITVRGTFTLRNLLDVFYNVRIVYNK